MGEGLSDEQAKNLKETDQAEILGKYIRRKLQSDWNRTIRGEGRVRVNAVGFFYESPDVGAFLSGADAGERGWVRGDEQAVDWRRRLGRVGRLPEGESMRESPVGLGATRDELRRLLGEPTDSSVPTGSRPQPAIWKYGDIEYHFAENGRVWLIYTEDEDHNPRVIGSLADV